MKPHSVSAFSAFDAVTRLSSIANEIGISGFGGAPEWMCQTGLLNRWRVSWRSIAFQELLILVDVARDHVEIEPLRRLGLAIHEERELSGLA